MIGCTPFSLAAAAKGTAPYRPLRSQIAIAGNPRSTASRAIALGSIAPSSIVYDDRTRKGTNGA